MDGEDPGIEPALIDAHLLRCASCRDYLNVAEGTRRAYRLQSTPPMPDLAREITKRNSIADRASRWSVTRAALGVVAIEVIAFSVRDLVLGRDSTATGHAIRHLGAFSIAYGMGLLVVIARPSRARTMLPVAAVLSAALVITAIVDVLEGRVPFKSETGHLPELLSVPLLWMLAVPSHRHRRHDRGPKGDAPMLRVVPPSLPGEAARAAGE